MLRLGDLQGASRCFGQELGATRNCVNFEVGSGYQQIAATP